MALSMSVNTKGAKKGRLMWKDKYQPLLLLNYDYHLTNNRGGLLPILAQYQLFVTILPSAQVPTSF